MDSANRNERQETSQAPTNTTQLEQGNNEAPAPVSSTSNSTGLEPQLDTPEECPICSTPYGESNDYDEIETPTQAPRCTHIFGNECLARHRLMSPPVSRDRCPMCREPFEEPRMDHDSLYDDMPELDDIEDEPESPPRRQLRETTTLEDWNEADGEDGEGEGQAANARETTPAPRFRLARLPPVGLLFMDNFPVRELERRIWQVYEDVAEEYRTMGEVRTEVPRPPGSDDEDDEVGDIHARPHEREEN